MNHAGEIGPLSRLVRPDIAIITTVAPVHLQYFKSVDEIADAKAEIFEGLQSKAASPSSIATMRNSIASPIARSMRGSAASSRSAKTRPAMRGWFAACCSRNIPRFRPIFSATR